MQLLFVVFFYLCIVILSITVKVGLTVLFAKTIFAHTEPFDLKVEVKYKIC